MRKMLCLLLVLGFCLAMIPCVFAEMDAVEAKLTAIYVDNTQETDIAVTVEITNGLRVPISSVNVCFHDEEGYLISGNDQTVARIDPGETAYVQAVFCDSAAMDLPSTGDNVSLGMLLFTSIFSLGCVVLLLKRSSIARRVFALLLCVTCAVCCVYPQDAYAAGTIESQNWPDKLSSQIRSSIQHNTESLTVSNIFQAGEKQLSLSAVITYTLPSSDDNLNDGLFDIGDLHNLISAGDVSAVFSDDGSVLSIDGALSDQPIRNTDDAAELLNTASGLFNYDYVVDASEVTVQTSAIVSDNELTFYRYSPSVNGVEVLGSQIVLAVDQHNRMRGLTSSYSEVLSNIDTEASVSADVAQNTAWEELVDSEVIRHLISAAREANPGWNEAALLELLRNSFTFSSELIIYAASQDLPTATVYRVHMTSANIQNSYTEDSAVPVTTPVLDFTCYIFANGEHAGEVHSFVNNSYSAWSNVMVNCEDMLEQKRSFRVQKNEDGKYRMKDAVRGIETYRVTFGGFLWITPELPGKLVESKGTGSQTFEVVDVSAHANMAEVYDFYMNVLGRDSYDGNGKTIVVSTEYDNANFVFTGDYYNAFWTSGQQQFVFGDEGNLAAALDVAGHEYTHAVINYVVGNGRELSLTYQYESGALNESYADIMGCLIEDKSGRDRWLMGEDSDEAIRSLADPSIYGQPEHYSNRYTGTDDNGGVHHNSSIFAFAAYKMMNDSRLSSVSEETWAKLFYQSLFYLTNDATLLEGRIAVILAANDLGFDHRMQEGIKDAFDAVGICEPESVRIVLTWGADPVDLDSHLTGPSPAGGRFHVYYGDQEFFTDGTYNGNSAANLVAELDYDDVTSYGPEVTTIHVMIPGTYYFYVHDYTTYSDASSLVMADSGACVKVYYGNSTTPAATYTITPGKRGTIWNVCQLTIDSNKLVWVTPINTYGNDVVYN